jgi:hypothetical protein
MEISSQHPHITSQTLLRGLPELNATLKGGGVLLSSKTCHCNEEDWNSGATGLIMVLKVRAIERQLRVLRTYYITTLTACCLNSSPGCRASGAGFIPWYTTLLSGQLE